MGTILFILFLLLAAFVAYVIMRKKAVPIGHIAIVLFQTARTRWFFDEGPAVVPPGCSLEFLEVKDHIIPLTAEDVGCSGVKIIMKGAMVRYRLRQITSVGSGGRFRMTLMSFVRRIIPYSMDSRVAEFLSMQSTVASLIPAKAHAAVNTFCASRKHEEILGYHVTNFVNDMIATKGVPEKKSDIHVDEIRSALNEFVLAELTKEFESMGLEFVSFTVSDFDPDAKTKQHIEEAQQTIRELQVRRLQTTVEVDRFLDIATAVEEFIKKNPGTDPMQVYQVMRKYDNDQLGAANLATIGQIGLAFLDQLRTPAKEKVA